MTDASLPVQSERLGNGVAGLRLPPARA